MYLVAASIGALTLVLPHSPTFRVAPVAGIIATGFLMGALLLTLPPDDKPYLDHAAMAYAIFAIAATNVVSSSASAPYTSFFFWPVLLAAWFFPKRVAAGYVATCALAAGMVIASLPAAFDGAVRWTAHTAAFGVAAGALMVARTRVDDAVRELHVESRTDPLTGVSNRRDLEREFARHLDEATMVNGRAALAVFDLDAFKAINDEHGHAVGDKVLRRVARALVRASHLEDVVARLGGDEFAVLMPRRSAAEAVAYAQRVQQDLARSNEQEDFLIGASVGVAEFPAHGADPPQLLSAADEAAYRAKRAGGRQVAVSVRSSKGSTRQDEKTGSVRTSVRPLPPTA